MDGGGGPLRAPSNSMSLDKRWRLVCYDVRDPKRYREVYKIIKGCGRRLQYSVFRCHLDEREAAQLRWRLAKVMATEDRLLIVDLCPHCAGRVIARNHVAGWTEAPATFEVLPPTRSEAIQGSAAVDGSVHVKKDDSK